MRSIPVLSLVILSSLKPLPAWAVSPFMPRLTGYNGNVTLEAEWSTDKDKKDTLSKHNRKRKFRESMTLGTGGYVYHPDLLTFTLSGSLLFDQERKKGEENTNIRGADQAYDFKSLFLRRKPYNVEIYSKQERPFLVSLNSNDETEKLTKHGIELRYRESGFTSTLKYDYQDEERKQTRTKTDIYDLFLSYFSEKFYFLEGLNSSLWAMHQDDKGTASTTFDSYNYTVNFGYKFLKFSSRLDWRANESSGEESSTLGFSERLSAELPYNLYADFGYSGSRMDTERTTSGVTAKNSNDNDSLSFGLTQKLYKSLVSRMQAQLNTTTATSGTRKNDTYLVDTTYRKRLPYDSELTAGLGSKTTKTERSGSLPITDIIANISETDTFALTQSDVDSDFQVTVEVYNDSGSCSQDSESCWISLSTPGNYTLDTSVSPYEITISAAPNLVNIIGLTYSDPFTFRVKYRLNEANYSVQTDRIDFHSKLNLMGFITGTYKHSTHVQKIIEGEANYEDITAVSPKITDDILLLSYDKGPYFASTSYQMIDSNISQRSFVMDLRYENEYTPERFKFIKAVYKISYRKEDMDTEYSDGVSDDQNDVEKEASYVLGINAQVPRVLANVILDSSYVYHRGDVPNLILNDDNLYELADLEENPNTDVFTNAITLEKSFVVPWAGLDSKIWGTYERERTTGDEDTLDTLFQYGLSASRAWIFGSTIFSINANYTFEKEKEIDNLKGTTNLSEKGDSVILFKMVRKLF